MEVECGRTKKAIALSENGPKDKPLALVCLFKLMEVVMKVISVSLSKKEKALKNFRAETFIQESMSGENLKDLVNTIGKMVVTIKEILKKELGVDMGCGKKVKITLKNTKANLSIIKRKDTGYILGKQGICTKDITMTIYGMVMAKCFGLITLFTKVNGRMTYKMVLENCLMASNILKVFLKTDRFTNKHTNANYRILQ